MATLASTIINRVVKPFQLGDATELVMNAGGITAVATQVTVSENYRVGEGSILEMGTELCLVTGWDATNKIADLQRGWMDTTAVLHAQYSIIVISPRVYRYMVKDLFNNCLVDLYPRLFAVESQTITYASSLIGYTLDTDADQILAVYARHDSGSKSWGRVNDFEKVPGQDTAEFTTGQAIMIRSSEVEGAPIRITYTKPFAMITTDADDLEAVAGLQAYMTDLPYYFAMSRLMTLEEVDRAQSQAAQNHQRSQDVPGFLALRTGEWYLARYNDLLDSCRQRQTIEVRKMRSSGYGG